MAVPTAVCAGPADHRQPGYYDLYLQFLQSLNDQGTASATSSSPPDLVRLGESRSGGRPGTGGTRGRAPATRPWTLSRRHHPAPHRPDQERRRRGDRPLGFLGCRIALASSEAEVRLYSGSKWSDQDHLEILHVGDIVYVKVLALEARGKARVSLEQDSGAEGALVAIDNATGEIKAMVGGRDFNLSKFNRATQALRQVGSSFKPYVYTAVIDQGGSPDDTIWTRR